MQRGISTTTHRARSSQCPYTVLLDPKDQDDGWGEEDKVPFVELTVPGLDSIEKIAQAERLIYQ